MDQDRTGSEHDPVAQWLRSTPIVSAFCTQNGWVDDDTVVYEVRARGDGRLRINVYFTEVVMEGSGCVADRIECFGQMALRLDDDGRVVEADVV